MGENIEVSGLQCVIKCNRYLKQIFFMAIGLVLVS